LCFKYSNRDQLLSAKENLEENLADEEQQKNNESAAALSVESTIKKANVPSATTVNHDGNKKTATTTATSAKKTFGNHSGSGGSVASYGEAAQCACVLIDLLERLHSWMDLGSSGGGRSRKSSAATPTQELSIVDEETEEDGGVDIKVSNSPWYSPLSLKPVVGDKNSSFHGRSGGNGGGGCSSWSGGPGDAVMLVEQVLGLKSVEVMEKIVATNVCTHEGKAGYFFSTFFFALMTSYCGLFFV
jgi:hypothetical protein